MSVEGGKKYSILSVAHFMVLHLMKVCCITCRYFGRGWVLNIRIMYRETFIVYYYNMLCIYPKRLLFLHVNIFKIHICLMLLLQDHLLHKSFTFVNSKPCNCFMLGE